MYLECFPYIPKIPNIHISEQSLQNNKEGFALCSLCSLFANDLENQLIYEQSKLLKRKDELNDRDTMLSWSSDLSCEGQDVQLCVPSLP